MGALRDGLTMVAQERAPDFKNLGDVSPSTRSGYSTRVASKETPASNLKDDDCSSVADETRSVGGRSVISEVMIV